MRLEEISWKQAERYFERKDIAVIPVGSIENHGSQLALGTDYLIPKKLTEWVERELDVLILPGVPYGVANHHHQPGGGRALPGDEQNRLGPI